MCTKLPPHQFQKPSQSAAACDCCAAVSCLPTLPTCHSALSQSSHHTMCACELSVRRAQCNRHSARLSVSQQLFHSAQAARHIMYIMQAPPVCIAFSPYLPLFHSASDISTRSGNVTDSRSWASLRTSNTRGMRTSTHTSARPTSKRSHTACLSFTCHLSSR